jgi:RND family efflux transporter MFP subunit
MKNLFTLQVLFFSLLLFSCSSKKQNQIELENYIVTQPIVADTVFTEEFTADIQAFKNVEIRSRINGFINKIHVDEGATVKNGQLLFTISSQEIKHELLRAKAQLKSAIADAKIMEVEVSNKENLVSQNIVSSAELEIAKAKLDASKAKIEEMESAVASGELKLSFASIQAPFNGRINRLPLKTGSLISEGTLLTSITDDSEIFAYFNFSEKQYLYMMGELESKQREDVRLVMADNQLFPIAGKIETTENEVDKNTGNLAIRARFKNAQHLLKHGSSGKIQLSKRLSKAILIPQKATFEVQDKFYVYVLNKQNVVAKKSITIAHRLKNLFAIDTGLSPDDRILFEGIQHVKEGDEIIADLKPMRSLINQMTH